MRETIEHILTIAGVSLVVVWLSFGIFVHVAGVIYHWDHTEEQCAQERWDAEGPGY